MYCNKNPCKGDFCCRPFLFVTQGFCFHPYYDYTINAEGSAELEDTTNDIGNTLEIEGSGETELEGSGENI
ncbi:hypothetical protein GCK32_016127 [Trichostrongylus colubriformis]|uniref:Uncharacterized protein n=1 Tax=Trichostrongylus colubriformis TaxID=6319 RepID=A0AAN8IT75_TRICO